MANGTGAAGDGAALAGLWRLLGRPGLGPSASRPDAEALRRAVNERFDQLVAGLLEETAASDDVHDQASARAYLEDRLRDLAPYLATAQVERLRAAVGERIARW